MERHFWAVSVARFVGAAPLSRDVWAPRRVRLIGRETSDGSRAGEDRSGSPAVERGANWPTRASISAETRPDVRLSLVFILAFQHFSGGISFDFYYFIHFCCLHRIPGSTRAGPLDIGEGRRVFSLTARHFFSGTETRGDARERALGAFAVSLSESDPSGATTHL